MYCIYKLTFILFNAFLFSLLYSHCTFIIARKLYINGQFHCDRRAFHKTISALDSHMKQKLFNNVLADKKLNPDYMLVQLVVAKQGRRQGLISSQDGHTKKKGKMPSRKI